MPVDDAEPGLRERKRRATRRAIQLAALQLVGERGLDGVTIDEISRVADVSARTFFNYFESKDDALIGDPPQLPPGEMIERFVRAGSGGSLFDDLAEMLIAANSHSMQDLELTQLRHAQGRQYPHLFTRRILTMRTFEDEIAAIVERRLENEAPLASGNRAKARLVTFVAFAAMRHAWTGWASSEQPSELPDWMADSFAGLKDLFASRGS